MAKEPLLIIALDYQEQPELITTIRCKALDGTSHNLRVKNIQPRFWTEKNPEGMNLPKQVKSVKKSKFTSVEGTPLWEIRVDVPSQIREVREFFFPHYCADVSWPNLVRWISGWSAVIEVDTEKFRSGQILRPIEIKPSNHDISDFKLNALYYDIETADSLDMDGTPEPIVSIAIYDERTDTHECATIRHTSERQVRRFMSSQEALQSVVEHDNPIPPLVAERIHVHNIEGEDDIEREAGLLWWFDRMLKKYDPDVIAGQNILGYDNPYMKNRCINQRRAMEREHRGSVPVWATYPKLFNRHKGLMPSFDTKRVYAEQVQGAAATTGAASLAWMGQSTLGYGKVPRTSIKQMMDEDPLMLVIYNIWDNVVAHRCMDKLDLLSFYQLKVGFHNSTLHSAHSNMMLVEDMMGHLLRDRDAVMPSLDTVRSRLKSGGIEAGGFVMDAPSGVWRNAFELDNSMEYPSVIITCNADPSTKVREEDYPDGFPFPVARTPLGRIYRQDIEGLMPSILRGLASERERVRGEMAEAYKRGEDELGNRLNQRQRVMKENMNSWYGVLGSGATDKTAGRPFRLVDGEIGSDITDIARRHNDWNKHIINRATLIFTQDGIYPDPQTIENENIDKPPSHLPIGAEWVRLRFKTLYQDTDSCKTMIENHDEAESKVRPFTPDDIYSCANILTKILNDSFDEFVQTTLGVPKNEFFRVKPDAFYARYFQWGVKKRYAYVDFDGKHGFRGVEMRRSSSPKVVKSCQERLFKSILDGDSRTDVNKLIRDIEADMLDPAKISDADFGQPMGMKKEGTQAHKAGMWSNKNLGTAFSLGDKPVMFLSSATRNGLPTNRLVAIEWGDDPADFGIVVDRKGSIEKFFVNSNSFKQILGAIGTSWESARAGMSQSTMGDWFN
jgi:DNA polymerase elongation subunit (family B)